MKEEEYRVTETKKKEKELFGEIFSPIQTISENQEQRVVCLVGEPEPRVGFTLANINGFQPIRAKWNG